MANSALVVGPNSAWQRLFRCGKFQPGQVVRGRSFPAMPAGKGVNCARALKILGARPTLIGGCGPEEFVWNRAVAAEGIEFLPFPLEAGVRFATTVVEDDTGIVTELVEDGPAASPQALELIQRGLTGMLPRVDAVAVCGSFPEGVDMDALMEPLMEWTGFVLVDSVAAVQWILAHAKRPPQLALKLNASEWSGVGGSEDIEAILQQAQQRLGGGSFVATLGDKGCSYLGEDQQVSVSVRPVPLPPGVHAQSTGAGDAFSGGWLAARLMRQSPHQALRWGMAAARASCTDPWPARFRLEDFHEILSRQPEVV